MQPWDLGPYFKPAEHYSLLSHVVNLCNGGTALEFGVATGTSTRIIAEKLPVIGFDSFNGLPEDWRPGYGKGRFAHKPPRVSNCELIIGLFNETLPAFDFSAASPISLVHLDADLYSSTATALEHVGPHLNDTFIVFDEFHGFPGADGEHEQRAWAEFVERTGVEYDVIGHSHEAWAIKTRGSID